MMRYILATEMSGQICKRMCQICKRAPWAALQESGHRVAREFPGQRCKRVARPLLQVKKEAQPDLKKSGQAIFARQHGHVRFARKKPGQFSKRVRISQITFATIDIVNHTYYLVKKYI